MSQSFADKLLRLARKNSREIAEHWYSSVSKNARTPSFHSLPKETCISIAELIYQGLETSYFSEKPQESVSQLLDKIRFVEFVYARNIPLPEAIYALIIMRRQIWLYAELQAIFVTLLDITQSSECINRVVLIFDYIIYCFLLSYYEISKQKRVPM